MAEAGARRAPARGDVPPPGSEPGLLWRRFTAVVGLDPDACPEPPKKTNASIGFASTELLRRVNAELGRQRQTDYNNTVKNFLALESLGARASLEGRARLDDATRAFAVGWNRRVPEAITASGVHLVGDLDDLPLSVSSEPSGFRPAPDQGQVLDAAALAVEAMDDLVRRRARRRERREDGVRLPSGEPIVASSDRWADAPDPWGGRRGDRRALSHGDGSPPPPAGPARRPHRGRGRRPPRRGRRRRLGVLGDPGVEDLALEPVEPGGGGVSAFAPSARSAALDTDPSPPAYVFVRGSKESTLRVMPVDVLTQVTTCGCPSAKVLVPWIEASTLVPPARTVLATHRARALPFTFLTSSSVVTALVGDQALAQDVVRLADRGRRRTHAQGDAPGEVRSAGVEAARARHDHAGVGAVEGVAAPVSDDVVVGAVVAVPEESRAVALPTSSSVQWARKPDPAAVAAWGAANVRAPAITTTSPAQRRNKAAPSLRGTSDGASVI